jgi:hypothetical protein
MIKAKECLAWQRVGDDWVVMTSGRQLLHEKRPQTYSDALLLPAPNLR